MPTLACWESGLTRLILLGALGVWPMMSRADEAPAPASKTVAAPVAMDNKPWNQVLEWLSDRTGLPVLGSLKPKGTFRYKPGLKKTYSVGEVVDILNEALGSQKILLVRRERSFILLATDQKLDEDLLPRVRVEDLPQYGTTEIVLVTVPLRTLQAGDIVGEVEKLLGPHGRAAALVKANRLVLRDRVGNLKLILQTIKDLEGKAVPAAPKEKRIAFTMQGKPWDQVFQWLTEQTGLPVYASSGPIGTLTIISPAGKTYTIPEILDLLNDAMASEQYIMIRTDQAFALMPHDRKLPDRFVPRVGVPDLDQRGNTEIVSIVFRLSTLLAEDVADDVKKLLGPRGKVVPLVSSKLVIQDRVGNLKYIVQALKEWDNGKEVGKQGK